MKRVTSCQFLLLLLLLQGLVATNQVRAQESDDSQILGLMQGSDYNMVTTARSPRPTSQIAENVTVITSAQIAELNAHTLGDVLQTVPGIQLDELQTPGSYTFFTLQGASSTHVRVLIDGVPQNNLIQSQASPNSIPVQQIERVEIIKGAASAAWGEALGGVINVITKSPNSDKAATGMVSASYGQRGTSDSRGELSGTVNRFGYYLSGGNLHSAGLLPSNGINGNNAYGKFTYDLPSKGTVTVGASFDGTFLELGAPSNNFQEGHINEHYSFLTVNYPLDQHFDLEVSLHETGKRFTVGRGSINPDGSENLRHFFVLRELTRAGSANLSWSQGPHKMVAGFEYEHGETSQKDELFADSPYLTNRTADRTGVFTNGAFSVGAFTLLPGVRFDHTGLSGDVFSYTLGATYRLTDKSMVRGYAAKGYSLPNAVWLHGPQRVWTAQLGAETGEVPFLWLKGTLFYNKIGNVEGSQIDTANNVFHREIRQGGELELRTVPWYSLSLSGGYTYTDAHDQDTHQRLTSIPLHLVKLGLHYDNAHIGLTGVLTGNYLLRYQDGTGTPNPFDKGMIWDLSLTQKLTRGQYGPELFFSGHNLFAATEYLIDLYRNTGRWVEGGVRCKF